MANTYKTQISKQIPARLQTREYNVLLNLVKKRNLGNKEELKEYLGKKEDSLRAWLDKNKQGSVGMMRKQRTTELAFISFIKKRFWRYLK